MATNPESQTNETQAVLEACNNILVEAKIDEPRRTVLLGMLRDCIDNENLLESINEEMVTRKTVYHKPTGPEDIAQTTRGMLFEKIALSTMKLESPERAETEPFERFLLESLRDPFLWKVDIADARFLSPEEREQLNEYVSLAETIRENIYGNLNDAISVTFETDEKSGKLVAKITGVIEAKNHRVHEGSADARQAVAAPQALYETVTKFKEVYPLFIKLLDLQDIMPEEIDIVPLRDLRYTIIQPENLEEVNIEMPPTGVFAKACFEYVPFTQDEVRLMATAIVPFVIK